MTWRLHRKLQSSILNSIQVNYILIILPVTDKATDIKVKNFELILLIIIRNLINLSETVTKKIVNVVDGRRKDRYN